MADVFRLGWGGKGLSVEALLHCLSRGRTGLYAAKNWKQFGLWEVLQPSSSEQWKQVAVKHDPCSSAPSADRGVRGECR